MAAQSAPLAHMPTQKPTYSAQVVASVKPPHAQEHLRLPTVPFAMLNIEKLQMAHADKQALDKLLKKRLRKFAADTALSFTTVTVFVTRAGLEATARCPQLCEAGYSKAADGSCIACAAGSFKGDMGDAACTLCPMNQYSLAPDAKISCKTCVANSGTLQKGADKVTDCKCLKGHAGSDGGPVSSKIALFSILSSFSCMFFSSPLLSI